MPQTFFPQFPYSRKYDLICLTPYHWQPCISQFCGITKGAQLISTDSLGLQVPVAVAKFSDLVIGYSLLPIGNRVSQSARNFAKSAVCDDSKLRNAGLPMVRTAE